MSQPGFKEGYKYALRFIRRRAERFASLENFKKELDFLIKEAENTDVYDSSQTEFDFGTYNRGK